MISENNNGKTDNTILIGDFGSQVVQLIANRCRKAGAYSQIVPANLLLEKAREIKPAGIIISGGPASVYEKGAPTVDRAIFDLGIPILAICYGHQLVGHLLGGKVIPGQGEYGYREIQTLNVKGTLFEGLPEKIITWMSHGDQAVELPPGFETIAKSETCPIAATINREKKIITVQFHPEVEHTRHGQEMINYFLRQICQTAGKWTMSSFKDRAIKEIREQLGKKDYVLVGVSGGVDSSTLSVLSSLAVGKRAISVFVSNGLLRKNEEIEVPAYLQKAGVKVETVDAEDLFLFRLAGVIDPEEKRKIIGATFIEVFEKKAKEIEAERGIKINFLGQGTLYPDVIESTSAHGGPTARIKSHHNVGGLPEKMGLKLIEPFREIFKDEVRQLAQELNLPKEIWARHPHPGPGQAIRCMGEVTREKLATLKEVDVIFMEELRESGKYYEVGQAFAVLTSDKSVGVVGDGRAYDYVVALRSVDTTVYMTAEVSDLGHEFLCRVANRIINEVKGVGRAVYDITSKPPGTIEWE